MRLDGVTKVLLLVIAMALTAVAVRQYVEPVRVEAQSVSGYPVYVEPGVQLIRAPDGSRQVYGKVMVDLRSGKVWGFPTLQQVPWPTSVTDNKPPTSEPFLLGRFALEDMAK
jgi:hypothetical protein